ncbi:MAG TPA: hypothetical protein PLM53_04925 [Spirochaetota bacterium]|nr:hypothetical protein [Spirochaetota bacterium]HPC40390.1 hypothetical protein [Spirochaetota bacterium]HPL17328.1 hypothetical protein [Spirochaetota bacterium]HQF07689.1 hypothetical protein [Spirochaetota bacterium]HQH96421.1 hypothetical protein [Spirochaetota bacterium]
MRKIKFVLSAALFLAMASACTTTGVNNNGTQYRLPDKFNFRFIARDAEIENPDNDRRSYYKVYIDKAEEGRTTTGLESQAKTYEATLPANRHLITVEKWVLDRKTSRYIKLNNIEQPKPNFVYFDVPEKKIVVIEMKTMKDGTTEMKIDFERK